MRNCLLYRVAGCLLFRSSLSTEVNGRTVRLPELSVILWVSTVERCPLSRVELLIHIQISHTLGKPTITVSDPESAEVSN